jgi:hypothetical protein
MYGCVVLCAGLCVGLGVGRYELQLRHCGLQPVDLDFQHRMSGQRRAELHLHLLFSEQLLSAALLQLADGGYLLLQRLDVRLKLFLGSSPPPLQLRRQLRLDLPVLLQAAC